MFNGFSIRQCIFYIPYGVQYTTISNIASSKIYVYINIIYKLLKPKPEVIPLQVKKHLYITEQEIYLAWRFYS